MPTYVTAAIVANMFGSTSKFGSLQQFDELRIGPLMQVMKVWQA